MSYTKKYNECFHLKKAYYSKRSFAINLSPNTLLALNVFIYHSCYFLKQFWKSSFVNVFSCVVGAASVYLLWSF